MTGRKNSRGSRSKAPFYVGGAILALLLIAFITTGLSGENDENGGSGTQEVADVSITGASLPPYSQDTADASVGMPMPEVNGQGFDGTSVAITNDGRPKVILLLTHW